MHQLVDGGSVSEFVHAEMADSMVGKIAAEITCC